MVVVKFLVISCGLSEDSRSAVLARYAYQIIKENNHVEWFDLRENPLPFCDGRTSYQQPEVKIISQKINEANGILIALPIYNYSVSAVSKNLIELTPDSWNRKVVSFLCAAGGHRSYMGVLSFANSLMLDYTCTILPDFVYAHEKDFDNSQIVNEKVIQRVQKMTKHLIAYTTALKDIF